MMKARDAGWLTMKAVGIGELLWDLLPDGPRLGGAPFNAIAHLHRLGPNATYITAVGRDELGRRALADVERLGVDTAFIQRVGAPTGVARVRLDRGGAPEYEIVSPAAYESLAPLPKRELAGLSDTNVLIFGTLAQRFKVVRAATQAIAHAAPDGLRLYDINLREGCWSPRLVEDLLRIATLAKMNDGERIVLARELSLPAGSVDAFARACADRFALRGVCVTRGDEGASLLLDGVYLEAPAVSVAVADTIGAGDAFTAGLGAGIVAGWPAADTLQLASRLAGVVVSREGAIPDWDLAEIGLVAG